MMDIHKKDIRRELINRYLNAETSLAEEKMLVSFYLSNKNIDEDEQTIAKMIRVENIHTSLLSDEGVQEYERIVNAAKQPSKQISFKWITWMGGIAASIALFFIISPLSSPMQQTSETVEIAQCIQQMVNLDMEDMISITATPIDECVWVRTELKDGSTKTFIMNRDENNKTTTLLAIN